MWGFMCFLNEIKISTPRLKKNYTKGSFYIKVTKKLFQYM